ncbi:MAG: SpoVA/SpoVAEb family sporulation membrane protein [Ruminococcaceae bacterium]|nr:SpoVA/SpoVAEb family sporulation membrane protein [Oscillospiraceae bacterium]
MAYFNAFWVGGTFCLLAQILIDKTKLTPARILTGYVCLGVLLSAVGVFAPLKEYAGAGASVPLVGFGHLLAEGVRTAVEKDGLLGALTGGLAAASAGITASLLFALVWSLVFKSRQK